MEQQKKDQPARKQLFKERVTTSDRTYFFDVRESAKGTQFLTINESRKVGDKFETKGILIWKDQLPAFTEAFGKVYRYLKER